MKIQRCELERMTPRGCVLHDAIEGIVCNKTIFLLLGNRKSHQYAIFDKNKETIKQ